MSSCKEEIAKEEKKDILIESTKINNSVKEKLPCDNVIRKVIESSNLDLKIYKDYFVRIEEVKNDSISIQVYFENNLSDNPKEKQIVESTIAWLLFLPNEKKLLNVTADPENPINIKYNFNDLNSVCESCNIKQIENSITTKLDSNTNSEDCKDITLEMGSGKICIIKSKTIDDVYLDIIKNEEVEDVKYFLKKLPQKSQIVNINKNGLMTIEYKLKNNIINIIMFYDGGVTEINLEKSGKNVKRSIIYTAD